MKYLIQALESRPGRVGLSDHDLKQLLSDVKDGRETKGSDDWYESLEKVVQELRTTPEAHWFLKPVAKKDVKDYHLVVKHPMDLGTVLKKVKSHTYKSKAEFKADIDLIWDNCLLYNTSPTHPIRNNAIQMKRKADHHLEFLVDAAASIDDPLAVLDRKQDDEESDDEQPDSKRLKLDDKEKQGSLEPGSSSRRVPETPGSSRARSPPLSTRKPLIRTPLSMARFQALERGDIDSALSMSDEPPVAGPSRTPSRKHTAAKQAAARRTNEDANEDANDSSNSTTPGGPTGEPLSAALLPSSEPNDELGDDRWWKTVGDEDLLRAGLPSTIAMVQDFHVRKKKGIGSNKGKERACDASMKPKPPPPPIRHPGSSSAVSLIHANIASLQSLRRTQRKLAALYPTSPPLAFTPLADRVRREEPLEADDIDMTDAEFERRRVQIERKRRRPAESADGRGRPKRPEVSSSEAVDGLKFAAGTMLAHVGFSGGSEAAVDTLTDVVSEFLSNLGRTMRYYLDREARSMSVEEIILHTLFENGTTELGALERYIEEDVIEYGKSLKGISTQMHQLYNDALDEIPPSAVAPESLFTGDDDVFHNNFVEDLGEDFFGFIPLCLHEDIGGGPKSLGVPAHLFYGTDKIPRPSVPALPFTPPPPLEPLEAESIASQIGLLQPFYLGRLQSLTQSIAPPPPAPPPPQQQQPSASVFATPAVTPAATTGGGGEGDGPSSSAPPTRASSTSPPSPTTSTTPVGSAAHPPPPGLVAAPRTIPDDPPDPAQRKLGPQGQVPPGAVPVVFKHPAVALALTGGKDKDKDGPSGSSSGDATPTTGGALNDVVAGVAKAKKEDASADVEMVDVGAAGRGGPAEQLQQQPLTPQPPLAKKAKLSAKAAAAAEGGGAGKPEKPPGPGKGNWKRPPKDKDAVVSASAAATPTATPTAAIKAPSSGKKLTKAQQKAATAAAAAKPAAGLANSNSVGGAGGGGDGGNGPTTAFVNGTAAAGKEVKLESYG